MNMIKHIESFHLKPILNIGWLPRGLLLAIITIPFTVGAQSDSSGLMDSAGFRQMVSQVAHQIDPELFHPHSGQTVESVLRAKAEYSNFLAVVTHAGLLPLLNGTTVDTTFAQVSFGNNLIKMGPIPTDVIKIVPVGGNIPGLDVTQIKTQAIQGLAQAATDAQKYALAQEEQITVFALTNATFAKLPAATRDKLAHDSSAAAQFLRGYIVNRGIYAQALPKIVSVQALDGHVLTIGQNAAKQATINGIPIVGSELVGDNGAVHALNAPLPVTKSAKK